MTSPKISVIIPVYNSEKYLHQCINSVLMQTFSDFELLLINDGSTDSSGDICEYYAQIDSRIKVYHKINGGVAAARNLGLANICGQWVSFLDSDDWMEPTMLSELLNKAEKSNAQIVFLDMIYHYPGELPKIYKTYRWYGSPQEALIDFLKQSRPCPGWGLINKSSLLKCKSWFPENITIYEDFHLLIRLVYQSNAIAHVETPLYNYRMQDHSIVHSTTFSRRYKDQVWAYNSILDYFREIGVFEKYAPSLYGRILHDYQFMVLDTSKHADFQFIYPEKKRYIWKSTTINLKLKIIMWCLTHKLSYISYVLCKVRNFINNDVGK